MICGKQFNVDACQLSDDILKNMFSKAEKLVCGQNTICPSPGSVNAKLVESKSGQRPHFVMKKASFKYNCGSDCPMWKCSKLCSHTIACAYQDGCLQEFLAQATGAPSFYALSKASTITKAGKKPQKRKASSKSSTKTFTKLREEMHLSENVAPGPQDHPMTSTHSSQPATSLFQSPISLSQHCKSMDQSSCVPSKAVQGHTYSASQATPSSICHQLHRQSLTSTSLIQSPMVSITQTHTPGLTSISQIQSPMVSITQTHTPGLISTSLIQAPTVSITQSHTPCVSVNRSKIFALSQPPMIQSPLISVSPASGQKASDPLSVISTTNSSAQDSSSISASTSLLPLSTMSINNLLSTLVTQILANHMTQNSSVAGPLQNTQPLVQGPPSTVPQIPEQPQPSQVDIFWVMMISGNISHCQGCSGKILRRGGDGKPLPPPDDLVMQHKECFVSESQIRCLSTLTRSS